MDYITIQYLNYLQYGPYTSYNTVQFQFFFLLNTIFSTMEIVSATTNTLLLTIYTQNKTQDKRTQNKGGWGVGTYLGQSMQWVNIRQKLVPFPKMFCKFVPACCNPSFYLIYSSDLGFIDL